ncbi:hypothetical protein HBI56_074280 [Parastagonospora nodorum]|uniref:Uncharacterized protein n=1 Tax=Phaeosphaeria nodorum (strain SN15 / ATCC MYA-4574 / FGSC 10173) TaxID=321614 RepID=A0A7U2EYZ0_PHANO|nr:hypothetical protein HBH56_170700 [Parastagonospora nodorum]QRC94473.1 hypothetical protein JI435_077070 [Parastagonospora nodorum SN15]KAH3928267.1 hypothetical protein HBH54_139260 [Parastagonospora nodorum]KAH3945298.1 hypothetical protein HBH53_144610 [Parastagonospora nodorum]KAH3984027.1 hypothetical protein HBH52_059610 [Parastagonospora nodorum]
MATARKTDVACMDLEEQLAMLISAHTKRSIATGKKRKALANTEIDEKKSQLEEKLAAYVFTRPGPPTSPRESVLGQRQRKIEHQLKKLVKAEIDGPSDERRQELSKVLAEYQQQCFPKPLDPHTKGWEPSRFRCLDPEDPKYKPDFVTDEEDAASDDLVYDVQETMNKQKADQQEAGDRKKYYSLPDDYDEDDSAKSTDIEMRSGSEWDSASTHSNRDLAMASDWKSSDDEDSDWSIDDDEDDDDDDEDDDDDDEDDDDEDLSMSNNESTPAPQDDVTPNGSNA